MGDREVRWPDESIVDWWWKPLYCLGLLACWASFGANFLVPLFLINQWLGAVLAAFYLWLVYPIGFLCIMDARNALAVFYVPLIARLGRYLPYTLFVAVVTLPLGVVAGGLLALAILRGVVWAVPAALVVPPVLFLYARFWGRLAWLVLNVRNSARRSGEVAPAPQERGRTHDPWAIPQEAPIPEVEVEVDEPKSSVTDGDDEWAEHPASYQVASAAPASSSPSSGEETSGGGEPQPFSHEKYYADYRKREEARKARAEGRKPGEKRRRRATFGTAFGADLWPFLNERRTLRAGLQLAVATAAFLVLLRIAILMLPVG